MRNPLVSMGMIMSAFSDPDVSFEGKRHDTSANRKARKERARELTRQRELELRDKNKK